MAAVPRWLLRHAQKCRKAFGLTDWPIYLLLQDEVEQEPTYRALATVDTRNLNGKIAFRRDTPNSERGRQTVTHEMLHLAQYDQQWAVAQIILGLVPEAHRDLAWALWDGGNDRTVERLSRTLTPLLDVMADDA